MGVLLSRSSQGSGQIRATAALQPEEGSIGRYAYSEFKGN